MNLAVVGAGYVGLVTAGVFAELGHKIWVVDIDEQKIKKLARGKAPFYEPGLEKLLQKNFKAKRLHFSTNYADVIPQSKIIFVCVGTPNGNKRTDLSYVFKATRAIAENLQKRSTVVIKSTVPPSLHGAVKNWMAKYTKTEFDLASVPEFLQAGQAIERAFNPFRIVIGAEKPSIARQLLKLHQGISGERMVCDIASAQLIKNASNSFLTIKISFANSLAVLCDQFGANVDKVTEGLGMDKRIGPDFLKAGLGYGGSCLPKDNEALFEISKWSGFDFKLLKAAQDTNKSQISFFVNKVIEACRGSIKRKIIVVLGLAFKPGTSDMREARSIEIIKRLKKYGARVRACDPVALDEARKCVVRARFFTNPYKAIEGADALLLVTEWDEYKKLDFKKIRKLMKHPVVVDGRNVYNRKRLEKLGFIYRGIGR